MKKQYLMYLGLGVITFLIVNIAVAPWLYTVVFPTVGKLNIGEVSVTWKNGTVITQFNYGYVNNNTATPLPDLVKVTNTGTLPATLSLSTANQVNITLLTLTWNYTGTTLNPSDSILIQLTQNVTASSETFGYDTKIDATG